MILQHVYHYGNPTWLQCKCVTIGYTTHDNKEMIMWTNVVYEAVVPPSVGSMTAEEQGAIAAAGRLQTKLGSDLWHPVRKPQPLLSYSLPLSKWQFLPKRQPSLLNYLPSSGKLICCPLFFICTVTEKVGLELYSSHSRTPMVEDLSRSCC